jgi:hypothetical protein
MQRSLKWGSVLGILSVGLALLDSIIITRLFHATAGQALEWAYVINLIFYIIAGILAGRATGLVRWALIDAFIAALYAGILGTISQDAVLYGLDSSVIAGIIAMIIIECFTALVLGPLFGLLGRFSRRWGSASASTATPLSMPASAAPGQAG